jgi:hypothetical protein
VTSGTVIFHYDLVRHVKALEGNLDKVQSLCNYDIGILEWAKSVIERILNQVKKDPPPSEKKYRNKVLAERAIPEHVR